AGPGRLVVLVRERRLPRQRRHRRGGARAAPGGTEKPAAIDRGLAWLTGMQSKDGGWGAFDADNTRKIVKKPPFCDFGEVIDPPSADVTAHVVEAFAAEGRAAEPAVRRGVVWLLRAQEPDGSWFGRWGANYVYGTGAVVPALTAAGARTCVPTTTRRWPGAVSPPRRRRPGRYSPCSRPGSTAAPWSSAGSAGWSRRSSPTGPGTSRSSPEPGSPATSTSTTTCTGWPSPSARSAAI